ncbi:MAG: hypothetical protein AAF677_10675 [Pseudomonadota bacterium]
MPCRSIVSAALVVTLGLAAGCSEQSSVVSESEGGSIESGEDVVDRPIAPLTAAEVTLFLGDSTLSHRGEERTWHVYFGKDGGLYGLSTTEAGGSERARGRWSVEDDGRLCRDWTNDWGARLNGCAEVYRFGRTYVFVADGQEIEQGLRRERSPGDSQRIL